MFTRKVAQLAYRWCASVRGSYGMSDAVKENSAPHNARSAELDRANEEYRSLLREQVVGNFCVVPVEAAMKEAGFGGTKGAVDAAALRKLVVPGDAAETLRLRLQAINGMGFARLSKSARGAAAKRPAEPHATVVAPAVPRHSATVTGTGMGAAGEGRVNPGHGKPSSGALATLSLPEPAPARQPLTAFAVGQL